MNAYPWSSESDRAPIAHPRCQLRERTATTRRLRVARWFLLSVCGLALTACDFGGAGDESRTLNPDDIDVVFQAISGTTRDEMKTTVTSNSEPALEIVGITVFFHNGDDIQIGQLPFVFIGDLRRGDTAEQQFGLPAGVERHDRYDCYRYRVGLTGSGESANATYEGTCG